MPAATHASFEPPRAWMDSLVLHGIKLGLTNIRQLAESVGNPHLQYPVVHVGGTNGKGSVVAFLAALLQRAGYRVGRFTSPHLLDITERFLINGVPISETALDEAISVFRKLSEEHDIRPTFFELNTAVAFYWFAHQKIDLALIEVGMGGRFDSTNIVTPIACAITSIGLDHTQFLGDTLEKIAFEKAGILKPGIPAVIGYMPQEALLTITQEAENVGAPLFCAGKAYIFQTWGTPWSLTMDYEGFGTRFEQLRLGLAGLHQAHNAAIAVSLALLLKKGFPSITESAIREGLAEVRWPGRMERILDHPPVLMDVAHNPDGCQALVSTLDRCVVVFSVSSDKDAVSMVKILEEVADPLILTQYSGARSLAVDELSKKLPGKKYLAVPNLLEALEVGLRLASETKPLVITGSIYAAGEARRLMMERYGALPVTFE